MDDEGQRRALTRRQAFGQRIRGLREERGWAQERLSEASHIHVTYISGMEGGKRNASLDSIGRLAEAFGVETRELF